VIKYKLLLLSTLLGVAGSASASYSSSSMPAPRSQNPFTINQSTPPAPHKWYAGVEAGYSISANNLNFHPGSNWLVPDGSWPTYSNMGNSSLFGGFVGYNVNSSISFDLTYDYRGDYQYIQSDSIRTVGGFAGSSGEQYNIPTITIQTVIFGMNLTPAESWGGFKPYVAAGIGFAVNKLGTMQDQDLSNSNTGYISQYNVMVSGHTQTSFAWKAGVGATYAYNDNFHFNLGYRLTNVGTIKTGTSTQETLSGTSSTQTAFSATNVLLNEVSFGLAYDFA